MGNTNNKIANTRKTNVMLVTIGVFIATFMTAIEGTIITTAMPTIVGSLHGMEIMNWVFSIYLLTSAMLTPVYGKLSDKIGRKPIFIFGTILFIVGSGLCGLAESMTFLIFSRAIQGMGAGAMMPVALTIIADMYPIEKRAKVMGLNSAAWGIASVFGPLAGGFIVDTVGWHWIFYINVPIGILLIGVIGLYLVEPKIEASKKKMDFMGSLSMMSMLFSLLLGFQLFGDEGFSTKVLVLLFLSILCLILFVFVEKRAEDPIILLSLFSNPIFVSVNLIAALASGFLMGIDVYIPMWMQGVLGLSAAMGGLVLAPLSIVWMMGSFFASRLLQRKSEISVMVIGLFVTLVGAIWLWLMPFHSAYGWFIVISTVLGVGLGVTVTTSTVGAQTSVPDAFVGVATSFITLARTIGQTVMVSIFGLIINSVSKKELAEKALTDDSDIMNKLVNPHTAKLIPNNLLQPLREILYNGLHRVFFIGVVLVALGLGIALLMHQLEKNKI